MKQDYDHLFIIALIGDAGVGKSNLLLRLIDDTYTDSYISTIVQDKIHIIEIEGKILKLHMWDLGGQERLRDLNRPFYRGAHGIIIVYDITNWNSFQNVKDSWVLDVQKYAEDNVSKLLVGNKSDLAAQRVVNEEEAKAFAREAHFDFLELSAKTGSNVDAAFVILARQILQRCYPSALSEPQPSPAPTTSSASALSTSQPSTATKTAAITSKFFSGALFDAKPTSTPKPATMVIPKAGVKADLGRYLSDHNPSEAFIRRIKQHQRDSNTNHVVTGENAAKCAICAKQLIPYVSRHHCSDCGKSVCGTHSQTRKTVQNDRIGKLEELRICDMCAPQTLSQTSLPATDVEKQAITNAQCESQPNFSPFNTSQSNSPNCNVSQPDIAKTSESDATGPQPQSVQPNTSESDATGPQPQSVQPKTSESDATGTQPQSVQPKTSKSNPAQPKTSVFPKRSGMFASLTLAIVGAIVGISFIVFTGRSKNYRKTALR